MLQIEGHDTFVIRRESKGVEMTQHLANFLRNKISIFRMYELNIFRNARCLFFRLESVDAEQLIRPS